MEKQLVQIINNEPLVSTLDIFDGLGVEHKALMTLIKRYSNEFNEIRLLTFEMSKVNFGRPTLFTLLNEEQVIFLITLMRNSDKVVPFKFRLTREFIRIRNVLNRMIVQQENDQWNRTRLEGKQNRKNETDIIKKFVEYAKSQGSSNAEMYYMNITKMEYKALFFLEQKFKNIRDILNIHQLSIIMNADDIVSKALEDGMDQRLNYKDIYKLAKERVEVFADIRGKTMVGVFDGKCINDKSVIK